MTYRRPVLQLSRPTDEHYRLTKQNHDVSCILYKPQRLRNQTDHPGNPKQPPYLVRGMIPETLQKLAR